MEGSVGGDADNMGGAIDGARYGARDGEEGAATNGEEGSADGEPFNSDDISSDDGSKGGDSDGFGKEK